MARNPFFVEKAPAVPPAAVNKLARVLATHLKARASERSIPDAQLRALHPRLTDDATWAAVKAHLEL